MSNNPLAEVFGFHIINESDIAKRHRELKLCPFNNIGPKCTKDKVDNPLGVCSVYHKQNAVITCPIRFRQDWLMLDDASKFLFGNTSTRTSLTEIKLLDRNMQSAGNIDYVIALLNDNGKIIDFGSLEVQGVYITGNLRNPFEKYMENEPSTFEWKGNNYPKPDYLSSSRKRLIPQMLYKGGIFKSWGKKQCVAIQKSFFETLPALPQVSKESADIAWLLYDLIFDKKSQNFKLTLIDTIYTEFEAALLRVTTPMPGDILEFTHTLQKKYDMSKNKSVEPVIFTDELNLENDDTNQLF